MRYMMLVYTQEQTAEIPTAAEVEKLKATHWAVMNEAKERGVLEAAEPLESTATAVTVRFGNSKPLITDGPFAETKEQLAGYYILDCQTLEEAISWAAKIPTQLRRRARMHRDPADSFTSRGPHSRKRIRPNARSGIKVARLCHEAGCAPGNRVLRHCSSRA